MNADLIKNLLFLVTGGFLVFLGITVTRDNFTSRVNRITGGLLFLAGLGPIFAALGSIMAQDALGATPIERTTLYSFYLVWELFFPTLVAFSLLFPYNRLRNFKRPTVIYLLLVPQVMHLVLMLAFGDIANFSDSLEARAEEGGIFSIVLGPLAYVVSRVTLLLGFLRAYAEPVFGTINLLYIAVAFYFLETGRRRQTNPRLTAQTNTVIRGLRLAAVLFALSYLGSQIFPNEIPDALITFLRFAALMTLASFFALAIVRRQFLDVRLVFRQSLIYTLTSVILVGVYIILSLRAEQFLAPIFGERAQTVSYFFIVFILLLFPTFSNWIDNIIRSMFVRTRTDYRNIMERFSRQVISIFDSLKLRQTIEETLKTALLVDHVYFVLYDDSVGEYAILQSDDYPRRTVINRDDMMLRGINLLDKPTPFASLREYVEGSALAAILKEQRVRLILPLKDAQHLVGFLALTSKAAGYRYTPEDYNVLRVLSNQMVTALTNARLYADSLEKIRLEEEMSMARQIQLDLLPERPPDLPCAMICAESTPSRTVGGDFYDFIPMADENRVGVVIADASGKGMPAALLIAQIQAIIRSEVNNGNPIPEIMKNMNQQIHKSTSAEKYVTLFYGEYDREDNAFHYANAGHNYPILVRANGQVEHLDQGGPIIGALPGMDYKSAAVQLQDDDLLFLFTDGLSEAMDADGKEYGEDRIQEFVVKQRTMEPAAIIDALKRDVQSFDPSYPPQDDTTMVILKVNNMGGMNET
ncbi:MAG: SpoIIE family protein phosphatase [Candidatus Zixiibacteriota bacterium]|nr:MAG: SpoIIE family protein phosphatase [candidate division Zixibacteria bacterium]